MEDNYDVFFEAKIREQIEDKLGANRKAAIEQSTRNRGSRSREHYPVPEE